MPDKKRSHFFGKEAKNDFFGYTKSIYSQQRIRENFFKCNVIEKYFNIVIFKKTLEPEKIDIHVIKQKFIKADLLL